jgi:putative transposase
MSRNLRTCLPDTTYHTISRCIETRPLMKPKMMKNLMIIVLKQALQKYSFQLIAYTIMDNHFHFYIKTTKEGESISRIMQYIKSQYARRFNHITQRTGPFWNERFKDTMIEVGKDPVSLFFIILFYILYNPVRSKTVADPRYYAYGSIKAYLDENYNSPVQITLHPYFIGLGNTFKERVKRFLELEELYRKRVFPDVLFS